MPFLAAAGAGAARIAALLVPALAFYNPGLAASLFFGMGMLFGILTVWRHGTRAVPGRALTALFAALVLVGLASALWSVEPAKSARTAINLVLLLAPIAIMLSPAGRAWLVPLGLVRFAAAGIGLALLLVAFEYGSGDALLAILDPEAWRPVLSGVTDFNRGFALLALISWPVAGWLWLDERRAVALILLAAVGTACLAGNAMAVKTGFAIGFLMVLGGWVLRDRAAGLAWPIVVTYCAVVPFTVGKLYDVRDDLPAIVVKEANSRLEFWDYLDRLAAERPLLGWGLAGSGRLPPITEAEGYRPGLVGWAPAYAHNVPLETRIDLGIPGLLLLAGILVVTVRAIAGLDRRLKPFGLATLTTALWISCFSFQAWSDSTLFLYGLPALTFGLAHGRSPPSRP